jgi:hypothetical protein
MATRLPGRQAAFQINIQLTLMDFPRQASAILLFVKGIAIAKRTPR